MDTRLSLLSSIEMVQMAEPQITSEDPNERKLARRLRIKRRLEAIKKQQQLPVEGKKDEEVDVSNTIAVQLQRSAELLEKYMQEGEEYVTNVQVATDTREVERREAEASRKEEIIKQLNNEAGAAQDLFDQIAKKWIAIQKHKDPLDIHDEMINQKEKCDLLISQKDEIIALLKAELHKAEINFSNDQKKQIEDINALTQRIEKQISFMRKAYQQELELLETVIMQERQVLIESNNKKWEELYKKRDDQEQANYDEKRDQVEYFENEMHRLRIHSQEHYRETKINLENNIEELQRELERIKALALINTEKLDYNYQILKRREEENIIIKSQQKRRLNKLQDHINDLRKKISDYESNSKSHIKKLQTNIEKLKQSVLDIESKADHFAKVNDKKFHDTWKMNKNEAQEVLNKIMNADRVLYEQQMGISWVPPVYNVINETKLLSFKTAVKRVSHTFLQVLDNTGDQRLSAASIMQNNMERDGMGWDIITMAHSYKKVAKKMLMRISDKTGFLAEKKIRILLKDAMPDQMALIRIDHIFDALHVKDKDAIDLLVHYFLPYTYCSICAEDVDMPGSDNLHSSGSRRPLSSHSAYQVQSEEGSLLFEIDNLLLCVNQPPGVINEIVGEVATEEVFDNPAEIARRKMMDECGEPLVDMALSKNMSFRSESKRDPGSRMYSSCIPAAREFSCTFNHPLVMSSVYVIQALKEFVSDYHTKPEHIPTIEDRLKRRRLTVSRLIEESDIHLFWDRYKNVFNKDRERIWDALYEGMKQFHQILKDRKALSEEVVDMRRQNAELKRLLANYLSGDAEPNRNVCNL